MYEKCCSCCSLVVYVVGLWVMGCWVLEDGARRPPSYFSLPSRMGSLCPILQQQARRTLTKNGVNIGRSQAKCGAKPCNKSGESLEKVVSHRPLWTWRTVVARVHIDRHEHEQRSVWDDFLRAFTQLIGWYTTINHWFSAHQQVGIQFEMGRDIILQHTFFRLLYTGPSPYVGAVCLAGRKWHCPEPWFPPSPH